MQNYVTKTPTVEQSPSYKFDVRSGNPNSFYFTTQNEIAYEVRFRPTGYIFENDPDLQPFLYEISIIVLDNPTDAQPPADRLVSTTVASIFGQFFRQHERVVVYICDTSDQRGLARHRKFTSWFERYKGNYVQFSDSITDKKGIVYFTSLIVRRDNPHMARVLIAFTNLVFGINESK